MQVFRQNYHQYYPPTMISNPVTTSRGRSLTPPSFKQNPRLSSMNHLHAQDLYYQHPAIYSDPTYYRAYGDPYLMQRLPPLAFLPSVSPPPSSRAYRNMYSSSGIDRYTTNMSTLQHHRRSRSRSRRRYGKIEKSTSTCFVAIHLFFSSHHNYLSFRLFYNCTSHKLNFFSFSKQTVLGEYYGIYIKVGFFRFALYVK
jgi:hypothetical protein